MYEADINTTEIFLIINSQFSLFGFFRGQAQIKQPLGGGEPGERKVSSLHGLFRATVCRRLKEADQCRLIPPSSFVRNPPPAVGALAFEFVPNIAKLYIINGQDSISSIKKACEEDPFRKRFSGSITAFVAKLHITLPPSDVWLSSTGDTIRLSMEQRRLVDCLRIRQ
jgi:hypothetical protein